MGLCNRGAQHHAGRPVPAASIARGYGYPESRRLKQSIYNYLWETTLTDCFRRFSLFPVQIARFWVLRTHAFSAAVALASVITHGGLTKTVQVALGELKASVRPIRKSCAARRTLAVPEMYVKQPPAECHQPQHSHQ
ncbi:hypothetical protein SCP_0503660 [Sparassis crispa]|uniref:Uncharacterized protein n=1 Tax=Sparassis crispa TaxID=139825 RepID=A0A401GM87_9APHY|nr:hypothetical protein SCP_0503660 [Sparassis crispa]GBE83318.1 hypothetical protein SCP_0503660 [Sparassis crispa]